MDSITHIAPGACMGEAFAVLKRSHPSRKFWWKFGLPVSVLYLGYCTVNKLTIDKEVRSAFVKQQIPHERYFTTGYGLWWQGTIAAQQKRSCRVMNSFSVK